MKGTFSNSKRGFTLVELVVVIAIIAILSGVGFAAYTGYVEYAQKGADRQTVGEIMHAIELANYDDPSLFENPVTVFISGPEGDGTTSLNTDIDNALSNALGDLTTVKLSEKSVGDPAAILTKLSSNSRYNDYITAAKDGEKATFADDVFGLWESVIEAKESFGGSRSDYLDLAIKYAKNYGTEGNSPALDNWKTGQMITDMGAEQGQAVALARNYCFAVYAAQQELTPAMQKQLQNFIDSGYGQYGVAGLHTKLFGDIFDKDEDDNSTKDAWDEIVSKYEREQADIDVKAYLALMAAAETIDSAGTMQDDELMGEMNKVLGSLNEVMKNPEKAETIKETFSGKCATIYVSKNPDGTLTMTPNPSELDTREKATKAETETGGVCELEHNTALTVQKGRVGTNLNFGSLSEISICSIQSEYGTCTFNVKDSLTIKGCEATEGAQFVTTSLTGITAKAKGDATVKITATDGSNTYSSIITVHVQ